MDHGIGIEQRNLKVEAGGRVDRPHSRAEEAQSPADSAEKHFSRACSVPPSPPCSSVQGASPQPLVTRKLTSSSGNISVGDYRLC